MKKQEKIFAVANLKERLKEAKTIVLTDFRGLTVPQISQLRSLVKKAGGNLLVVKNTLFKIAAKETGLPREFTEGESLQGPTAVVLVYEDEIAPIKAVFDFAKTTGLPTFKSGIWEDRVLTGEEVERLGSLPGRDQLVGKLISILSSPGVRLVGILSGNQQKLIYILKNSVRMTQKGGDY